MKLDLILGWPPSVNHYKKVGRLIKTKSGKLFQIRVNTDETKKYYFNVYLIGKLQMPSEWVKFTLRDDISYDVRIDLHPPDDRRRDIDNPLKVLLDSLVRAKIIKDDSQITRLLVQKMQTISHGKVIVQIHAIGENHERQTE